MRVIICLDDHNGIAFNNRRQSRDRIVVDRTLQLSDGRPLRMSLYSAKLFPAPAVLAGDDYLTAAGDEDFCFVELTDPAGFATKIQELIVFRWNRVYPADVHLTLDLSQWKLVHTEEFPGHSHDKITMEVYGR